MSFASDARELRGDTLIMLETHFVMSFLIFHLTLSLVICLTLLFVICLSSLIDLTIAHMFLVHERTALSLEHLVTAHVLIVVIVFRIGMCFPAGWSSTHLEPRHLNDSRFSHRSSRPTQPSDEVQRTVKTSSGRMVKCWIPKIYLTNPSTEPSTFSRPV
jgi:hypothetical protein